MNAGGRAGLERLVRLLETVSTPGGATALRTWRPFSLAAYRLVQGLLSDGWSFATVLDIGANAGQFARASLGSWPAAQVIAFEPLAEAAEQLRAKVGPVGRLEVHVMALGATDGDTPFHPHEYSLSSSALPVAVGAKDENWVKERPAITVPLRRLDSVLAGRQLDRPMLVKVDVQGSELDVLAGAERTMQEADAVLVEAAFEPMYVGQPRFAAVHDRLTAAGWALVRPLDSRRDARGRVVEADWLYQRPEAEAEPTPTRDP